jgi:hypothetical protein
MRRYRRADRRAVFLLFLEYDTMKTYTATLVTKQYQTVTATVPDDCSWADIEVALCENASLSDGEFENDLCDIEEVKP